MALSLDELLRELFGEATGDPALDWDQACEYVDASLYAVGAPEWARMLSGMTWTQTLVRAQRPRVLTMEDWERALLITCFQERDRLGKIKAPSDALPVPKLPPADRPPPARPPEGPKPPLDVMGGAAESRGWGWLWAMGILFGMAYATK